MFHRSISMLAITLAVILITSGIPSHTYAGHIGNQVDDFTLNSHRGVAWSLSEADESPAVVIAFLGTECPLVKLYGPRLSILHQRFADQGVAFVGINANRQDSVTEMTQYAEKHQIKFPLLKDVGNRVANQLGATRTPEVFILDEDRRIRYHGRIDDQYGVGFARDKAQRDDLAIALEELLAGKKITTPETEAIGCVIGRVKEIKPQGNITYASHIADIFNRRCVECHRAGEIAPFTLARYEDIPGWEDTILEVIDNGRMPPWFADSQHGTFKSDTRLSEQEKTLIQTWIKNGMPAGDLADLPEPPQFTKGWRMPKPDQVIYMRDEPFDVPATGIVDYQYFRVDPGWTEDKYIWATEARPDNRNVVHHIIAYVLPPGQRHREFRNRQMLVGYAPGSPPKILTDGIAIFVPAGSQLLFEMHYTPNGTAQRDRSYVGISFMDEQDVKKRLHGRMAINTNFRIPPRAEDFRVTADYHSTRDELLLEMSPHMHLRGKSFSYEAIYPDGQRETLLNVPKYDFNWQLRYEFAEPKLLPKGTRVLCTATYDNSEKNPVNPDPDKRVRWGDQSWDEMMIGFFDVIPANRKPQSANAKNATVDPTGVWRWQRRQGSQTLEETLTLQLENDQLTGNVKSGNREFKIQDAELQGDHLTFQVLLNQVGQEITLDFDAKIDDESMTGKINLTLASLGKSFKLPWTAEQDTIAK